MTANIATPNEQHRARCGRYGLAEEGDVVRCEHGVIYCYDAYWGEWRVVKRPRWYSFWWTKERHSAAVAALASTTDKETDR